MNRERKRKRGTGEYIEMQECKGHFMRLLGRVKGIVVRGEWKNRREQDREKEISKREIKEAIKRMRDGKAAEIDKIPSETWKHGGEELEEWIWGFCNRVWKREGWPEK